MFAVAGGRRPKATEDRGCALTSPSELPAGLAAEADSLGKGASNDS